MSYVSYVKCISYYSKIILNKFCETQKHWNTNDKIPNYDITAIINKAFTTKNDKLLQLFCILTQKESFIF